MTVNKIEEPDATQVIFSDYFMAEEWERTFEQDRQRRLTTKKTTFQLFSHYSLDPAGSSGL